MPLGVGLVAILSLFAALDLATGLYSYRYDYRDEAGRGTGPTDAQLTHVRKVEQARRPAHGRAGGNLPGRCVRTGGGSKLQGMGETLQGRRFQRHE